MKTRAAVLWGLHQDWTVEEIDLDPPKAGEVLVKWEAAGLCHSDEHLVTGDMVPAAETRRSRARRPASRSSAATRARASCSRSARASLASSRATTSRPASSPRAGAAGTASPAGSNLCDLGGPRRSGPARSATGPTATTWTVRTCTSWPRWARSPSTASSTRRRPSRSIRDLPMAAVALVSCGVATGWGSADPPGRGAAGRDGRRRRRRRRRHQRRPGGPDRRGPRTSSPWTRSSSSRRRRSTSAPPTRLRRWTRRPARHGADPRGRWPTR